MSSYPVQTMRGILEERCGKAEYAQRNGLAGGRGSDERSRRWSMVKVGWRGTVLTVPNDYCPEGT